MAFREPQPLALSRQAVLLVTAVGVGLIATSYILGVQVGKGSASLRKPDSKSVDEQLKELPEPLLDQLKLFQNTEPPEAKATAPDAKTVLAADAKTAQAAKAAAVPPPKISETKAPAPKSLEPSTSPKSGTPSLELWSLQLVSTPNRAEADRIVAKAKAAGFPAKVVLDEKSWKVRLTQAAPKEAADATAEKLRNAGFKPFAVRAD